jgi:hypothetical protein
MSYESVFRRIPSSTSVTDTGECTYSSARTATCPTQTIAARGSREEEPGFLDILAESEEAMPLFLMAFERVTDLFSGLGPLTAAAQEEMAKSLFGKGEG